jgi:sRNA-binding protein
MSGKKKKKTNEIIDEITESLRDWFKKEDWVRIDTQGNIAGKCGTMKKGKATTRCLPRKKAQSLSKAERKSTTAKKVRGSKKGKQFVKNTKKQTR